MKLQKYSLSKLDPEITWKSIHDHTIIIHHNPMKEKWQMA